MPDAPAVRVTRRFAAPPERVFDAWLDPKTVGEWLFRTPGGELTFVEIDAREGGTFKLVERREGEDVAHTGSYVEVDRPRRLVFTLVVEKYGPAADTVTVEVAPADGGAELTLSHALGADGAAHAEATERGWARILDGFAAGLGAPPEYGPAPGGRGPAPG